MEIEGTPEEVVKVLKLIGAIDVRERREEVRSEEEEETNVSRRFDWKRAELEAYRETYG